MEPVGLGRLGLAVVASDKGGQGGAGPATRRKICKALPSFFTSLNHLYINLHCVDLIPFIKGKPIFFLKKSFTKKDKLVRFCQNCEIPSVFRGLVSSGRH